MINRYLSIFVVLFFTLSSCNKFTTDEGVPSFIHIDRIDLNAGIGQGTDSSYIADAWIYIDGEFHGAFELPATFPILKSGVTKLTVRPGIIINGISGTRSINPFFKSIPLTVNLVPDSTVSFNLETTYISNAKFPWSSIGQEDFEQGGITIDTLSTSTAGIEKSKLDVYEGDYSGLIHLDATNSYFMGTSITDFNLPDDKSALLLELNCKNTSAVLTIGMYFNLPGGTVTKEEYLYINPTDNWKKLYVNFTQLLGKHSTANSFKLFFSAALPTGETSSDIFLDNIKLIHY